ncbi:peptidase U32 family protein [Sediminitomix flava]|uniref:Putative protease n=1 Tax=Sediminitomix flava TaxID=379075 RepID=A0A315ZGT7_SEDFL|nr:U32 family peptidase [Sediminitomix flava]PWJ44379.1 putative protease [Sediminitomix flava]
MRKLELLAPAKNLEQGKIAINYGADALYIGANQFGARANASNSLEDIEALIQYAHRFNAQVFVTLNTLLYEQEIRKAQTLIDRLYQMGADALIIQDMGLLELDLPPIPLHASTQTHNYELPKIQFMEKAGFDRVVLARELSLAQIQEIQQNTNVELEYFVAGALCVSFSGQCYMSHAIGKRSANRGECAQPCRLKYQMTDRDEQIIEKDKHLLSLKDLNLSHRVDELAKAGITSFKIEGRLKGPDYVKNMVTQFRKELDDCMEKDASFIPASSGKVVQTKFDADLEKTFNRGFTSYFLDGREGDQITSFDSPKSRGKLVGKVKQVGNKFFTLDNDTPFANGDGIMFWDRKKTAFVGTKINTVDGNKLFPMSMNGIRNGLEIFRNHDHQFEKTLLQDQSRRVLDVKISLSEYDGKFLLEATDKDQNTVTSTFEAQVELAQKEDVALKNIEKQLSKSGDSDFYISEVAIQTSKMYFFPASMLNQWRREVLDKLAEKRINSYPKPIRQNFPQEVSFPSATLDHHGNILNSLAESFYKKHGVDSLEKGFELQKDAKGKTVMTTKHCLKYEYGFCKKFGDKKPKDGVKMPYRLRQGDYSFRLAFDCKQCVMKLIME